MNEPKGPRVSVIVSVHNGARHLAETIESVINQTYPNIEIIVIDDGSTDQSGEIAQSFLPRVRYQYQSHRGIAVAWNKGVELAGGEYLAFNGADDLWTQDKIQRQVGVANNDTSLDIVFGHVKQFHSPELSEVERRRILCPERMMPGISAGTMLVKRKSFFRVGPFNSKWRRGIFNDWYLRATELGLRSYVMPELVMWRRLHGTNHGIVNRDKGIDYVRILKDSLDRRR